MTPPPRATTLVVIEKLITAYKLWHNFLPHLPKTARYSIATKIDSLFISTLEYILKAKYAKIEQKKIYLASASTEFDILKFFLRVMWEIGVLEDKQYATLSVHLDEIGRMLGGWYRQYEKTSAPLRREG